MTTATATDTTEVPAVVPNDWADPDQATQFLTAIFEPGDNVLLRPIETWNGPKKKESLVDYDGTTYHTVGLGVGRNGSRYYAPWLAHTTEEIRWMSSRTQTTLCNLFYGTCPRFARGDNAGSYDKAYQIRVVRTLWADVDDGTPEDAIERCKAAGLPEPSIVVASGRGAHLYWLLREPFIIDDAEPPRPVATEFIKTDAIKEDGSPEWIVNEYFLDEAGNRIYVKKDKREISANIPDLSPKAQEIQDVLKGIVSKIGGDHAATDISRILRVPGTLNRKNQRTGKTPVPCTLYLFEPERRYSIDQFLPFAECSPDRKKRELLKKVKLPRPGKLTAKKEGKLNELLLACDTETVGNRSEADFHACCHAIEHGISRDDVWRSGAERREVCQ